MICETCYQLKYEKGVRLMYACKGCIKHIPLSLCCSECEKTVTAYSSGTLLCEDCELKQRFTIVSTKVTNCVSCGTLDHVNAEGICVNCYISKNKPKRCRGCSKPTILGTAYCDECITLRREATGNTAKRKQCFGCSADFFPGSTRETFCYTCRRNLELGICTNCSIETATQDQHGWCAKCASNER